MRAKKEEILLQISSYMVDLNGIEPSTSRMRTERSTTRAGFSTRKAVLNSVKRC